MNREMADVVRRILKVEALPSVVKKPLPKGVEKFIDTYTGLLSNVSRQQGVAFDVLVLLVLLGTILEVPEVKKPEATMEAKE